MARSPGRGGGRPVDIGAHAYAAYPLLVDGRSIGSVTLMWNRPVVFTSPPCELMEALAAQAAQALDRARLLGVERHYSETLQRSLLAGAVSTLDTEPDLMIGVDSSRPRSGHDHVMLPGSTLVLYTDGLVERRSEGVDVGIARLAQALERHGSAQPESLYDSLMATMNGAPDDDVALVVLRVPTLGA